MDLGIDVARLLWEMLEASDREVGGDPRPSSFLYAGHERRLVEDVGVSLRSWRGCRAGVVEATWLESPYRWALSLHAPMRGISLTCASISTLWC